jgi:hypothetical protein
MDENKPLRSSRTLLSGKEGSAYESILKLPQSQQNACINMLKESTLEASRKTQASLKPNASWFKKLSYKVYTKAANSFVGQMAAGFALEAGILGAIQIAKATPAAIRSALPGSQVERKAAGMITGLSNFIRPLTDKVFGMLTIRRTIEQKARKRLENAISRRDLGGNVYFATGVQGPVAQAATKKKLTALDDLVKTNALGSIVQRLDFIYKQLDSLKEWNDGTFVADNCSTSYDTVRSVAYLRYEHNRLIVDLETVHAYVLSILEEMQKLTEYFPKAENKAYAQLIINVSSKYGNNLCDNCPYNKKSKFGGRVDKKKCAIHYMAKFLKDL